MRNNEFHGKYSLRYNGSERICSRLGDQTFSLDCSASLTPQTQQRLGTRIMKVDQNFRAELLELVEAGDVPVEFPNVLNLITLLPSGSNANSNPNPNPNSNPHTNANTSNDIFYYHTNHLGSTAYVTDQSQNVTQGFLYAPFGEITTEYAPLWQNGIIPKYTFNAKELDEETGMYYYEARYYNPPVFTSRDPMFEKYFWMTPYAYCANNPVKYVDPSGEFPWLVVWGIIEVGVAVYDAYETGTTILDPNASLGQKIASAGGFALGAVLPGGGYGKGAKFGIKQIEKLSKAGVTTGKKLNNIRGFASRNQLNDRFLRHGKEFGDKYKTAEEYLKGAQSFFKKEGEDIIQYSRKNGDIVKYDTKNNILGIVDKNGNIKTMFKPEKGMEYIKNQIKKDLEINDI